MCDFAGGPTSTEKTDLADTNNLQTELQSHADTNYANQQQDLTNLTATIQQIKAGQTGPGFGAAENNAQIANIQNNAAASARNAEQAERNASSGQVFGGASDSSGLARSQAINREITGTIAANAGNAEAAELNKQTQENYAVGRANAAAAEGGFSALADDYGQISEFSQKEAAAANERSFSQSEDIEEQRVAASRAIAGLAEQGISMAAGGIAGGFGAGGGFGDTVKGILGGVLGDGGQFLRDPSQGGSGGPGGYQNAS